MSSQRRISLLGGISLGGAALLSNRAQAATNLLAHDGLNSAPNAGQPAVEAFVVGSPQTQSGEIRIMHYPPSDGQTLVLGKFEGDGLTGRNFMCVTKISVDQGAIWNVNEFPARESAVKETPLVNDRKIEPVNFLIREGGGLMAFSQRTVDRSTAGTTYSKVEASPKRPGAAMDVLSMNDGPLSEPLKPARYRVEA
jgi:hypothetical protein